MYNTGYEVIFVAFSVIVVAQIVKFFAHWILKRQLDFRMFTTTGGMPSSHAAGVMGLSTTVGLINGFNSVEFAIAISYAFVVMYDAAGLRRSTGKIAACLNKIRDDLYAHGQMPPERLKELLGHTPFEVFVGALLGAFIAFINHYFLF